MDDNGTGKKREKPAPPKPRKHPQLYQAHRQWVSLTRPRTTNKQHIAFIQQGLCNLDLETAQLFVSQLDPLVAALEKEMAAYGSEIGPAWDWLTGIKGIGTSLAAQLFAQIDDIEKFETVSKLWRFCGLAVFDGRRERPTEGEKLHYCKRIKGVWWNMVDQFIRHQTPEWVDLYYAEKTRQRAKHPEPVAVEGESKRRYTDGHIDLMARRRVAKELLKQLWIIWRSGALPSTWPTEPARERIVT